ncbi:MAG TPA: PilZ domain-containing protein [Rhodocyclaceae bacterium]
MHEKRKSVRYLPRSHLVVTLSTGGRSLDCQLGDLSASGCMVVLSAEDEARLQPQVRLTAELRLPDGPALWSGRVTRLAPWGTQQGAGVVFDQECTELIERLMACDAAGALRLGGRADETCAEVSGHLGFAMHRCFFHLLRSGGIAAVSLRQCTSLDSAGIGLLKIAHEAGVPLLDARGAVRDLLVAAGILRPAV